MDEIVVAHYQENLDWLPAVKSFDKKIVYNKYSGDNLLDNVGRESNTYFYHIINNYDSLADYTMFCQGDPIFHYRNFVNDCNDLDSIKNKCDNNNGIIFFGLNAAEGIYSIRHPTHPLGLPLYYFLDLLFGIKCGINDKINMTYAANFLVKKENILSRPKAFYQFLNNFVSYDINPIEGFIFERLWHMIFDPNIPISDKYLQWHI